MMGKVNSIYELRAWQKGMDVVSATYEMCKDFPKDELFALTNQTRRCAVSIPANIAEGFGRFSHPEFLQFLKVARGSIHELRTHIEISIRVGYVTRSKAEPILMSLFDLESTVTSLMSSIRRMDAHS